jgi:hypothetical protein
MFKNSSVFWEITLCDLVKVNQHSEGMYYLHIQGLRISQARKNILYSGGNKLPPLPGSKSRKIRQTNNQKEEHNFCLTTSTRTSNSTALTVFLSPGSRIMLQPFSGINIP